MVPKDSTMLMSIGLRPSVVSSYVIFRIMSVNCSGACCSWYITS
jgi:hypothetical protein